MEPITQADVLKWMEEVKNGTDGHFQSVEDGKRQYESVLAEYKRLIAIAHPYVSEPWSEEDQVALFGVACNRVFP